MIGLIFRVALSLLVLAGLILFFAYAFVAALIVTPFLLVFLYLLGRRTNVRWWVVREGSLREHRDGPIIDHDPDALPEPREDRDK